MTLKTVPLRVRLTEEDVLHTFEVLGVLEATAGEMAAQRIKPEELAELVGALGLRLLAESSALRPADFQRILRQIAGRPEEKLVSYLVLRTMKLARLPGASRPRSARWLSSQS